MWRRHGETSQSPTGPSHARLQGGDQCGQQSRIGIQCAQMATHAMPEGAPPTHLAVGANLGLLWSRASREIKGALLTLS